METPDITYKTGSGRMLHRHKPSDFAKRALANDIQPVRVPVSYQGQHHLPGYFWMSRQRSLVAYESRLEMTILLQLDFNRHVAHVVPQPFLLHYGWKSKRYQHTPDFLVQYSDGGAEVINVKPKRFVRAEKNVRAFQACNAATIEMGFAYSTRSEIDRIYLSNLKWLAGYRRPPVGLREYRSKLIDIAKKEIAISAAVEAVDGLPALTRPILFHLLWIGDLTTNMHERMTGQTKIQTSAQPKKS